jgi:ABC-2 type transport system ATP-binding protein
MSAGGGPAADGSLRVRDLRKVYGKGVVANDGISLQVAPGEVYGLLGPYDLVRDPAVARQLCSYLPQAQMPIEALKVHEAIQLTGLIRGGHSRAVKQRTDELIAALELDEWRNAVGTKLSGGVRRLVGFAMVTVYPGRLVILDEPTNDVDPLRRRLLWEQVRRLAGNGVAVALVTHNVLEAEKAVDRLAIVDNGRLVAEGTPSSLKADTRGRLRLQVMLMPGTGTPEIPVFVERHSRVGNNLVAVIRDGDAAAGIAWAQELVDAATAEEYALGATTLEDVYIRLTGHSALDEPELGTSR